MNARHYSVHGSESFSNEKSFVKKKLHLLIYNIKNDNTLQNQLAHEFSKNCINKQSHKPDRKVISSPY